MSTLTVATATVSVYRAMFTQSGDNKRLSHGVLVIARSINPSPHYQPESFSSRADNDRGLILRAITNPHVIICLSHIPFHNFNARLALKNAAKSVLNM